MTLVLRWILSALSLVLAAAIVPGFAVAGFWSALWGAFFLGLANALIRPLLLVLTFPVTVVTLGLFVFVVNALMLWLVSTVVRGFTVDGFVPALLAAIVLWIVGMAVNWFLKETTRR